MPRLCVFGFGCAPSGVPMHRFPNVKKFPDLFKSWVILVGGKLESPSDYEYYQKKRVCDIHFTDKDRNRNNRIRSHSFPSFTRVYFKPNNMVQIRQQNFGRKNYLKRRRSN